MFGADQLYFKLFKTILVMLAIFFLDLISFTVIYLKKMPLFRYQSVDKETNQYKKST